MNIFLHGRSLLFKDTVAKIQRKWNHSKLYPYFMYNKPSLFSPGICYQPSCKLTGNSSDAVRNAAGIILFMRPKMKPRPCCGGLKGQQSYSPRQRLGFFMPCDDCAPKGQKHFLPNGKAFALPGRRLLCYPCSPGCCPGLVAQCPFQGRKWQLGWGIVTQQSECRLC